MSPDDIDADGRVGRRTLLRAAGAGIGALSLSRLADRAAATGPDCANGPFEATYEAGAVDVGQIRAERARGESPESMGAASPAEPGAAADPADPPGGVGRPSADDGPLSVRTEYDGVDSLETRGGVPSDSQVAAGDGKLLHVLNRYVATYNKRSGTRQRFFRLERLWEPVIPEPEGGFVYGTPFVFDPRARYDRGADRFVVAATQYQLGITGGGQPITREMLEEGEVDVGAASRPPKGWFLVAVSATSNPNGRWYVYRVPPEDADGPNNRGLVDYPTLGFDRDAVYLTQNFFGPSFDVTAVVLDKAALYDGEAATAYHFDGLNDPAADGLTFTVQPAQQPFSGGQDGSFYLVNANLAGVSETLTLWELADPLDEPSLSCHTLSTDPYSPPPTARQPGSDSRVDTIGTRLMNADVDGDSLWTAHATAIPGDGGPVAAVRWYEIDLRDLTVAQSGTLGDPSRSTFMPTVGADDGRVVVVHNVSGPETFPRMDVAARTDGTPDGEFDGSVVVESGVSPYDALPGGVERWGDYNGVSVDPASGSFWTVSQYSPDVDIPVEEPERDPYATRIAEVEVGDDGPGRGN